MESINLISAAWGLFGAFWYAAPKLSTCAFTAARKNEMTPWQCIVDAVIALIIGSTVAAVSAPLAQLLMHRPEHHVLPPLAAALGFFANPLGPALPKVAIGVLTMWANNFVASKKAAENEPV